MEVFVDEEEEEVTKGKRRAGNGQEADSYTYQNVIRGGHGARGTQGGSWTLGEARFALGTDISMRLEKHGITSSALTI